MLLFSCNENEFIEKPITNSKELILNSNDQIPKNITQTPSIIPHSELEPYRLNTYNFTPINDVSGNYLLETQLIDISNIPCDTELTSISDGDLTLIFDKPLIRRKAQTTRYCTWTGTFGFYPDVEGPDPYVLYSPFQNIVGISISKPVTTLGFEIQPNLNHQVFEFEVEFYNSNRKTGSIKREINAGWGGAKLFAAETEEKFDYVIIRSVSGDPYGFAVAQFRYILKEISPITIDFKPGNCNNTLNVNSKGVIPLAILGSMDLDVNNIDLSTVFLNGVSPSTSSMADLAGHFEKQDACDCSIIGKDEIMDLNLKFDTQALVESLGEVSDGESVEFTLTFETLDGRIWKGEDCVDIIKKK